MIPHSASTLAGLERDAAAGTVARNFLGPGPEAVRLEVELGERYGRRRAFAVSTGFHALLLAVRALDLAPGARVALPTLTCPSVLAAVESAGHRAILADVDEASLAIDPERIGPVDAVVAPHAYGAPADARAIAAGGRPWIEDCATSPSAGGAARTGTLAVLSFAGTKYVTAGAGGAVLTDDETFAARIEWLLDMPPGGADLWRGPPPPHLPGRLADLNAAVARVQLARLDEFHRRRRELAAVYGEALRGGPWRTPELRPEHGFYRYVLLTEAPAGPLAEALRGRGIDARDSVNPWLHRRRPDLGGTFPVADRIASRVLSLPIYPTLSDDEADRIARTLRELA